MIVQLVLLIMVYTGQNMTDDLGWWTLDCPDGSSDLHYGHKPEQSLIDDYCTCKSDNNVRRVLTTDGNHLNMFDLMGKYFYIPAVGCVITLVLAFVWLLAMRFFGQSFIWISMALILGVMVTMAILLIAEDAGSAGGVVIGFAVVFVLYLLCRRQIVNRAGETLETACDGLWQNYSIFAILAPMEAAYVVVIYFLFAKIKKQIQTPLKNLDRYLGYIFFWMFGWAASYKTGAVKYDASVNTCAIEVSGDGGMYFASFLMLWMTFYMNHVKVNVVGATVAAWAFGQESAGSWNVSTRAAKWSFWHSSPTLSLTSLVCTCIERLKRLVENKCNWANPACCALMIIGYCLFSIMQAFGRFSAVLHSITGKAFYESAYHSFRLLIKGGNLESAIAADYFIGLALGLVSYILSVGIGMVMWVWGDSETDMKTLDPNADDWQGWFWFFFIMMIVLTKYPYVLCALENHHFIISYFVSQTQVLVALHSLTHRFCRLVGRRYRRQSVRSFDGDVWLCRCTSHLCIFLCDRT